MKKIIAVCTTAVALVALPFLAQAQAKDTPVGLWKTFDDETKQAKSLIRITEKDGVLSGKIEKLLDPTKQESKCLKCTDDRKDKLVLGMTVLTGLKKADGEWNDGQILDPTKGEVYKAKAVLRDGGKQLDVRGFLGIALLGRTQTWVREE